MPVRYLRCDIDPPLSIMLWRTDGAFVAHVFPEVMHGPSPQQMDLRIELSINGFR
jgi:hypothetical protein